MNVVRGVGPFLLLFLFVTSRGSAQTMVVSQTNLTFKVMAANLTSGNSQRYETPGLDILQGLKPDIVAMQEFNVSNSFGLNTTAALSNMVATTFGSSFVYFRETGYNIPNGIISRYPVLASGSWTDSDSGVNDRGFAWARIDLPGTNELYVVSVHLKASSGSDNATRRGAEAAEVKDLVATNFPANAWIVVAGDMNLYDETELAIITFKTFLSDSPVPADQNGGTNTNAGRTERYDRVLPSFSMTNTLVPLVMPSRTYAGGLVFDSRVYTPLSEVSPVQFGDSGALNMQHMGVLKAFQVTYSVTNYVTNPPSITVQPANQTVAQGANATFTVTAGGQGPFGFQWRFNGGDLSGATASTLTRTNAQPANRGSYSVVINNSGGSTNSSDALLTLIVPSPVLTEPSAGLIRWQGLSNLVYTVQAKTNLTDTTWLPIGTASSPTATVSFTNQPSAPRRFYRVVHP